MKRLLIVLALWAPLQSQDLRITVPYSRFVLSNGLNVILHQDRTTPTVSLNIWYHVGSGREKPGRTGFAHLFEHIMFEGSKNVPEGKFDEWLEGAGGSNNGSTNTDRTNYYESFPTNALELALFLESDRLGYLVDAMSPEKVDGQRDVVKNERRQRVENQPYGMASIVIGESLYPPHHPYHWPVIGSMEDLSAASYEDVVEFFKTYYVPNNASLVIAGDIDIEKTKRLVEKWFGEIPAGPEPPPFSALKPALTSEVRLVMEDKVQLPRIYMVWHSPAFFEPGDAEMDIVASVLAGGKNSRLYKRLVYELQIAQDVYAYQASSSLASSFWIVATARTGHTLQEIEIVIREEMAALRQQAPTEREVRRTINQYEARFLSGLEGIGEKADRLNSYYFHAGNPDFFNEDLSRYRAIDPEDVRSAALTVLVKDRNVVLSIVPEGQAEQAAANSKEVKKP
jgi:zinc protease